MAANDRILRILLQLAADSKGADEVKGKLQDLKKTSDESSQAFSAIGTAIGISLGTLAAGTVAKFIDYVRTLGENERRLAEDIQKGTDQLRIQEIQWTGLARTAGRFFDVVKVGMSILPTINKLAEDAAAAQAKTLDLATNVFDRLGAGLIGQGPAANQLIQERTQKLSLLAHALKDFTDFTNQSTKSLDEWQRIQAGPVTDAITTVDGKLAALKAEMAGVGDPLSKLLDPKAAAESANKIAELGREYAVWSDRREKLIQQQEKENKGEREGASARRANLLLFREQATILQNIHEQEQLIRETPFLGIDERNAALLGLYNRELGVIATQIQATKTAMQNSALDPAQIEQLRQKLQQLTFEFQLLGLKMVGLQKPFQASMIEWANSFGSAGEQVAKSLQGSIGVSLQSLNQMLITGKFSAQQMVEQLANIGLQLIENLAIQQIMRAFATTSAATSQAEGAATAAAWAPAAAATSVGSFGTSAVLATVAIGVIAAIIAALTLHEGGPVSRRRRMHGGGLAADEVPIIAQEGEFMVQRSITQSPGMIDFLMALNAGAMFHKGGGIRRLHGGGGEFFPELMDDYTLGFDTGPGSFGRPSTTAWGGDAPRRPFDSWGDNQRANLFGISGGFGTTPYGGFAPGGATILNTFWNYSQGYGWVPMAVPVGGWTPDPGVPGMRIAKHTPPVHEAHLGGLISRLHSGGILGSRFPRFHGGKTVRRLAHEIEARGGNINIAAFVDHHALAKWLSGRKGRSVVFDIFRGNRIDLGI